MSDGSAGRGARGYNPDQPRVSAGHPDGGQWTYDDDDEVDEYDWEVDLAGPGHHWLAKHFYKRYPFSPETERVFRYGTSGPLISRVWSRRRNRWLSHGRGWDRPHRTYDDAVENLLKKYMKDRGINSLQMTPAHAREVLDLIQKSDDPHIRPYVQMIHTLRRFQRRYGGRGGDW